MKFHPVLFIVAVGILYGFSRLVSPANRHSNSQTRYRLSNFSSTGSSTMVRSFNLIFPSKLVKAKFQTLEDLSHTSKTFSPLKVSSNQATGDIDFAKPTLKERRRGSL